MVDEERVFEILNRHQVDTFTREGNFVIQYMYNPIRKSGKEFLDSFNLIYGKHGKEIYFSDIPYEVVNGHYGKYEGADNLIDVLINKYTKHFAEGELRRSEPTNVNVNASSVDITNVEKVTIYTEVINTINTEKFMYEDELNSAENVELLKAIDRIEADLKLALSPSREDLSIVRKFAKTTCELTGFAANIITILAPFLSNLK